MLLFNTSIDPISKLIGPWIAEINIGSILIRLVLAIILGGVIGTERATKNHAAGLRTYILVSVGSCVAMLTNLFIYESFGEGDIARLGAQVISGIGFLGAGTIIITSRSQIKGLTTAAGLWASATIGLSIGIGFYTLSILGMLCLFFTMTSMKKIENHFTKKSKRFELHVELDARVHLKDFLNFVRGNGFSVKTLEHNPAYASSGLSVYSISLDCPKEGVVTRQALVEEIKKLDFVNFVEEIF